MARKTIIKCYSHSNLLSFFANVPIEGTIAIPGNAKKLVGAAVISPVTCQTSRENGAYKGFRLKLQTNNKGQNPINFDYHDGYVDPFTDISEPYKLIHFDCDMLKQNTIDYCIIPLSTIVQWEGTPPANVEVTIKLYLKFEIE